PSSNLFVSMSRGNVALSSVLTVTASMVTILSLPLFSNMALQHFMGEGESIVLRVCKTIGMLVGIVLLPVAIGMLVRTRKPELARKAESLVSLLAGVVQSALLVLLGLGLLYALWDLL